MRTGTRVVVDGTAIIVIVGTTVFIVGSVGAGEGCVGNYRLGEEVYCWNVEQNDSCPRFKLYQSAELAEIYRLVQCDAQT